MNLRVRFLLTALLAFAAVAVAPSAATADPVTPAADEPPAYTEAPIPTGAYDYAFDGGHQKLWGTFDEGVRIFGLDGTLVRQISFDHPRTLTLSPDGKTMYVIDGFAPHVVAVDTTTYAQTFLPTPGACPYMSAYTGGRVWFAYTACATGAAGLGSYDPVSGYADAHAKVGLGLTLRAVPGRPDRLLFLQGGSSSRAVLFDVSGAEAAELGSVPSADCCGTSVYLPKTDEIATIPPDGSSVDVRPAADLTAAPVRLYGSQREESLEVSPDGKYLASLGWVNGEGVYGVTVRDLDRGGEIMRTYAFPDEFGPRHQLHFTGDGRILATGYHYDTETSSLYILNGATMYDTRIKAELPVKAAPGTSFVVSGGLDRGPGAGTVLAVTRTDRAGTHTGTVTTAADGTFTIPFDGTGLNGRVRFTVSYAGDAVHEPSSWTGQTLLGTLAWDFNGDGYTDVAVGTPGEDDGGTIDTGQFHVLYGTASGVTASGSRAMDQNTPGVDGTNEPGDTLGQATASADFNGDGYADLAVGAPGEDDGTEADAGMIEILYGSAAGLTTTGSTSLWQGIHYPAQFGRALATGDFNGDGYGDLAASAPGAYGGRVLAYFGGENGFTHHQWLWQGNELPGADQDGDRFGWSLATGDVDADGNDDLAIGIPGDSEDKGWSTGAVMLVHGRSWGLWNTATERVTKDTPGVPGAPGTYEPRVGDGADEFGLKVAMGDFNNDGKDDLAVSAPGTRVGDQADAGSVTVLYSDGTGPSATGSIQITQDTEGIIGLPYDNDFFGDNLAAADSNGDGADDLAIFSYGDEYVTVTPGATGGLALTSTVAWTQDSPGIPGSQEAGDKWGASLRFLGGLKPALLVGAPGEDSRQGAFTVVWIGPNGLTGQGAQYFGEGTPGVPGEPENGDRFGTF